MRAADVDRHDLGGRQPDGRLAHRGVLDVREEDRGTRVLAGGAPDGCVDGLGAARGEDHFTRCRTDEGRYLLTGFLQRVARTMRPSSCRRPGSAAGRAIHRVRAASASGRGGVVLA